MKVLVVLTLTPDAQLETVRAKLDDELKESWALYAAGVLREVYATEDPKKVVFVLEASDREAAKRVLASLPMIEAGMFKMEVMEIRPFVNWATLFAR